MILNNGDYVEYTWWAKDAAKSILEAAHVEKEEDFTLELSTGNSKDGNPYTIWLLDGDSKNDWMNKPNATKEEFKAQVNEAINEVKAKEVVGEVVDYESLAADVETLKKQVKFLEEQSGITDEDENIPF